MCVGSGFGTGSGVGAMPLVNLDDEEIAPELVSQQTQHHSTGSTDDTDGTSIQIGTDIDTFFKPLAQHRYWGDK